MSDWRDPEIEADLAAERALPTASPELRAALYERVLHTAAAPTGSTAVPAAGAAPKLALVVALLAGVGGWVAYEAGSGPAAVVPTPVAPATASDSGAMSGSTIASSVEAAPADTAPTEAPPVERARPARPVAAAPRAPRPARPAAAPASTLAAEQALLERARRALAADDHGAALIAIEGHGRRFAAGQLAEERELLRVQALVRAGRRDEAQAHAARFRRRFADSLLLEALNVALAMPPEASGAPSAARFEEN